MNKEKQWIVSFQHTSAKGIKAMATCATGKDIREALSKAHEEICKYLAADSEMVITDIGIANKNCASIVNTFWPDPVNEPDPELF